MKRPKIRTILFSEVCPLACTYCMLKTYPNYGAKCGFTKEKLFKEVEKAHEDGIERILFTGGEPFAFWPWIKEIIEKYGSEFEYSFNTSGYYCTDEVLEFLSKYKVYFTLSVDGPKKIAQWRRPNNGNYKYDYWDKFLENYTAILYYFPQTAWKTILTRRMIEYIPDIFDAAHEMGFRRVDMVIDFKEEGWRNGGEYDWTEKDWEKFEMAMSYVSVKAMRDIENGEWPTLTGKQIDYLRFIVNSDHEKPFELQDIQCGVAEDRDIVSMYQENENLHGGCLKRCSPEKSLKEIYEDIKNAYEEGCPVDKKCPYFRFCAISNCLKDNMSNTGSWFSCPESTCRKTRVECGQLLLLLNQCKEEFKDNLIFRTFLNNKVRRK